MSWRNVLEDSTTYQAVLNRGRAEGMREAFREGEMIGRLKMARRVLISYGGEFLGRAGAEIIEAIEANNEIESLERMVLRVRRAKDWAEVLATP